MRPSGRSLHSCVLLVCVYGNCSLDYYSGVYGNCLRVAFGSFSPLLCTSSVCTVIAHLCTIKVGTVIVYMWPSGRSLHSGILLVYVR